MKCDGRPSLHLGAPGMRWAVISVLALVSAAGAVAQTRVDDAERVIEAFLIPFSNRDIPTFIEFFADDATMFLPPSAIGVPTERIQGKQDIAREFEALYKRVGVPSGGRTATIRPLDLNVQRFGDVAVVTFHLGTESARGRRTFVLRQTGSTWKIVHLHASDFRMP
jgi:ketosteroid isomerase-like protein